MRPGSILLLSFVSVVGPGSCDRYPSSLPDWFHKDRMHETHFEPKKCAHIVIWELSGSDPNIAKPPTKKFSSNMPILPVPPPCIQDSATRKDRR
jgi:hypothetical protein